MSVAPPLPISADPGADRFPSLAALRLAHSELLKRLTLRGGEELLPPGFLEEVGTFLRRGLATGVFLDADEDRCTAQALLDYWTTVLYRAGQEPPDATLHEPDQTLQPDLPDERCPYRSLDAVRPVHGAQFYGWQRLIQECAQRLAEHRFLALVGPSGSGRSSLVQHGLLPLLKEGRLPGSEHWRYYPTIVPGPEPLASLTQALQSPDKSARWPQRQMRRFRQDPTHLERLVRQDGKEPAVFVIDGFDQLFTLCDRDERNAFLDNLLTLLHAPGAKHVVIAVVRSDFLSHVDQVESLKKLFQRGQVFMAFDTGELRQAIEEPANLVGLKFDEGLVDRLLLDIQGDPAAVTLLQFSLLQLWDQRQGNRITWEAYNRVGAGRRALERAAESLYQSLDAEDRPVLHQLLLRLIKPGEGQEATAQVVRRGQLDERVGPRDRVDRVIDRLVQARLVHRIPGDTPDETRIALAHESLLAHWPRLIEWLGDARYEGRRRLRLTEAAVQWRDNGRDRGALWGGSLLQEAAGYSDRSELEEEFIQASRKVEADEASRERRLFRFRLFAVGAIALLVILVIGLIAHYEATQKKLQQQQRVKLTVAHGIRLLESDDVPGSLALPGSLAWFVDALESEEKAGAAEEIRRLHRRRLGLGLRQLPRLAQLWRDPAVITFAEFSPDGKRVVAASGRPGADRGVAWVWDVEQGHQVHQTQAHPGALAHAAFSPNGLLIATACGKPGGEEGEAKVWRLDRDEPIGILPHKLGVVNYVAFSSKDGKYLVTASGKSGGDQGEVQLHEVKDGTTVTLVARRAWNGGVLCATFSPDTRRGPLLVVAGTGAGGSTGLVQVWDVQSFKDQDQGKPLWVQELASRIVYAVFSSDGRYLAVATGQQQDQVGEALVWDWEKSTKPLLTARHKGAVFTVAFDHSDRYLATASHDQTARVWRVADGKEVLAVRHAGSVFHASFSPNGHYLATGSRDRTARVWDLATGEPALPPLGHAGTVTRLWFSPDSRRLLTAGHDTARVWELATGHPSPAVLKTRGQATEAALSADGSLAVTVSTAYDREPGEVQVWDVQTSQPVDRLGHDGKEVSLAALRPDGKQVVTVTEAEGGKRLMARVWDVGTGNPARRFDLDPCLLQHVALSPDGHYLVVCEGNLSGNTGQAQLWKVATGEKVGEPMKHKGGVIQASFSPDGNRVVTASADDSAQVWKVPSAALIARLGEPHTADVTCAAFSRDGGYVVTASADQTAVVWEINAPANRADQRARIRHGSYVSHAGFGADFRHVVTVGHDGRVRLWYLADAEPGPAESRRGAFFRPELVGVLRPGGDVRHTAFQSSDFLVTLSLCTRAETAAKAAEPLPAGELVRGPADLPSKRWVQARRWDMRPEQGSAEQLRNVIQMVTAHVMDPDTGGVLPIPPTRDLGDEWKKLKSVYHSRFPAEPAWLRR